MDLLNWRFIYIAMACIFWIVYVVIRCRKERALLYYWGFRTDNFWKSFLTVLPFGLLSVFIFFVIGQYLGTNIMSWHIIPLLFLYPIWGCIQHFLMMGLLAGNLRDMESQSIPGILIVVFTSILFSIVHFPFQLLVLGTFLLAIFYCIIYLKEKNLYVLGIFHGWLGAFFFYTVMERDAFLEVFGKLSALS
ncbi:MAG: hypothetical protein MRZ79_19655 [Bacteroidia bacterium]|nr:hypothetical protein [Bacteroidia bacterium]